MEKEERQSHLLVRVREPKGNGAIGYGQPMGISQRTVLVGSARLVQ
jgi:hypothetical protein